MKAIGYQVPTPELSEASFSSFQIDAPRPGSNDLLVEVAASSVNPVDYKQRQVRRPESNAPVVLGWDAAGTVVEVGSNVCGMKPGDAVYYSGEFQRPGANAELQLVDYRIAAKTPGRLDFMQAAALPLTALTAYEAVFEKLKLPGEKADSVVIAGRAGGADSIAI